MNKIIMHLKEYCNKNKDLAEEQLRCGACCNQLIHCGKYEIVSLFDGKEESILCETCKKHERDVLVATRISSQNNNVFYVPTSILEGKEGPLPGEIERIEKQQQQQKTNKKVNNNNAILSEKKEEKKEEGVKK